MRSVRSAAATALVVRKAATAKLDTNLTGDMSVLPRLGKVGSPIRRSTTSDHAREMGWPRREEKYRHAILAIT
jgi:hypothetical protein